MSVQPDPEHTREPRLRISFRGTPGELRAFLAQLCLLASDDQYEWDLSGSIARHPAGKKLHPGDLVDHVFEGRRWRGCRHCGSTGPLHVPGCDTIAGGVCGD